MNDLEADDGGIRFGVEVSGRSFRVHISYQRLLGRYPTRAERALPPKYLFAKQREPVDCLVTDALAKCSESQVNVFIT